MLISFGIASRCGDTLSRGFGPIPLEALTKAIEGRGGKGAVEIQAVDYGPGFIDVAAALKDHYSTGGTLRLGLPGSARIMDSLEIESQPGQGATVTAKKWARPNARPNRRR